ncbi:glycosyltransferase [Opitutus sp. GAS368]|jgi:glycosyltransferase involved in cell wall biosynthesis|uniref:glycosyltransferase n=1 Tax=Opitutus sp. GAS368 TaxID=1882749 RepID=UPI00087D7087|nr:glycosyltransferase [Opitutus sp. GAS368]SDS64048.1 Glycosyltransferase involved in cell wall bisynthesis [Opitutus sp. GAS368]
MARILIVSPGSPCRNPRPVKEAQTLGAAGHDVVLLTVSESPELDVLEKNLTAGAAYRHETVGRDPSRVAKLLQRVGIRLAVQATIAGFETLHALGAVAALRRRARAIPADLTIVHNELPHWIGCILLDEGRRVAADFEDWHSEDLLPADRRGRPLARLREVERRLLHEAAYVSTTSAALSAALAARYDSPPPVVITNAFPLQSEPRSGPAGQPPAFFWFSQTIGPGRGLEEFCAAWARTTHPSRLVLLGQIRGSFAERLRAGLPAAFRPRLAFLPLVPPGDLPAVIARHDIGLALEQPAIPSRDLTITNKILQYLNAGLAVIASGTAGQREVLARAPGAGLAVDPAQREAFTRQLDTLLADRAQIGAMGAAARRAAETVYCWEKESPRLIARVEAALAPPRRKP